MISFRIEGASEIAKALQDLPARVSKEVAMQAMEAAVQPVVDAARALAPVGDTGALKRSIGFFVKRSKRRKTVTFGVIGPRRGFGVADASLSTRMTEPANYAHLVEEGHAVDGKLFQFVEPKPFLRPAWDATKENVVKILGEEMGAGIEAQAAILGQKTAKRAARSASRAANAVKRAAKAHARAVALGAPV